MVVLLVTSSAFYRTTKARAKSLINNLKVSILRYRKTSANITAKVLPCLLVYCCLRIIVFAFSGTIALPYDKFFYSNSSHRSFIPIILIALSLFWVAIFAIFAGIFFTVIKIVLKTYSCIKPIIYSDIQKLSLVIAFVPEFFYQLLKPFHGHFTIHFVPIFLLKQQHFMY